MNNTIQTGLWHEEPEDDNPYAAKKAYCSGYDIYEDVLGQCQWSEMVYLLFKQEAPDPRQAQLLNDIAVAIANPGPRDASVHAAMCGGVGKSVAASALMAALAVGAGQYTGAREVFLLMKSWQQLGCNLEKWLTFLEKGGKEDTQNQVNTWPEINHQPGFDPYGKNTPTTITTTLQKLAAGNPKGSLHWLLENKNGLEAIAKGPITMTMVIACTLTELDFSPEEGEMLSLILRLPGAAAHALEQRQLGHKKFPFYPLDYTKDPL